jgi:cyclic pyranopterin phosphate synthase
MSKWTHLNTSGEAHMVDVSDKANTSRTAVAQSQVELTPAIVAAITDSNLPKGDLYATARIAGIQAAKKTSDLIPLCHPLPLSKVTLDIELLKRKITQALKNKPERHYFDPQQVDIVRFMNMTGG